MNYLLRWAGWEIATHLKKGTLYQANTPTYLYKLRDFLGLPLLPVLVLEDITHPSLRGFIVCFTCNTVHETDGCLTTKAYLCPACTESDLKAKDADFQVETDILLSSWANILQGLHVKGTSRLALQAVLLREIALALRD